MEDGFVSGDQAGLAGGIEIERDILPYMEFRPIIGDIKLMDSKCFV